MEKPSICIVGLGYVGLPLAYSFARHGYMVSGFDVNEKRVGALKEGNDATNELSTEHLQSVSIEYSTDGSVIQHADIVIVALPTPVDEQNKPDLRILEAGSKTVGQNLKKGAIVVYESTVYPGVTEEICGPILEQESGMICGKDFTLGYSPERINPGDKEHTVETITKIVAGQDEKTADILCDLYGSIVKAGIHRAPNIKVAEMAKAIENAQRDINIAYVNEVAMLCGHIGIDTSDVLDAAGTKWNFLRFQPGLVGGHCIGVDPFYLVEKARQLGMDTQLITAGRSINDGMGSFIAKRVIDSLQNQTDARILILGLTFKENVPDTRNSRVHDVITSLKESGVQVEVHDPFLTTDALEAMDLKAGSLESDQYDAVLLLVPHKQYLENQEAILKAAKDGGLVYDLKSVLKKEEVREKGRMYVSL